MTNRCKYHHLVYGPRTIDGNLQIYKCLVKFLDVQLEIMVAMVRQSFGTFLGIIDLFVDFYSKK